MPLIEQLEEWLQVILKAYSWRRIDPVPCTPLRKPIAQSRVAIVSTAGLVPPGVPPFDRSIPGGDPSYRVIPSKLDVQTFIDCHRSKGFDHTGVESDRNLAFPLDRLRELEDGGEIGQLAPRHLSFMGSINNPERLVRETAPEAVRVLVEDGVDIALCLPV